QDVFLAREVAEKRAGADVCGRGDLCDGGFVIPLALEQRGRSVDQRPAGALSFAITQRQRRGTAPWSVHAAENTALTAYRHSMQTCTQRGKLKASARQPAT